MKSLAAVFVALLLQWPQFRGPDGLGTSNAVGLPLTWGEGRNVRWKTAVHGRAWSSPVVLDNQVWVSTATPDGRGLFAIAIDETSGRIIHDLKLFDVAHPQAKHSFNSYASPTPVIEPGRIYVTFGSPGTAAIDTRTGKVIWERRDLECNHYRGAGSSPILFRDLLIMHFDGSDIQYVVALDKRTGKTVWRTPRSVDFRDLGRDGKPQAEGDFRKAFATPHVIMVNGQPILISIGSKATYGYDPMTGKELWRLEEPSSFFRQHTAGRRQRPRLLRDRIQRWPPSRGPAGRTRRRHRHARRLARDPRRAEQTVIVARPRPAVHGQRRRDRDLSGRPDRPANLAIAVERQLLGVADLCRRARLLLQ
jgi:hypothetical protein